MVGHDKLHVAAPAYGSISPEATDRYEIVRLLPKTVFIEVGDWHIDDLRGIEVRERCAGGPCHAGGTVFKECLVCGDLARLRRPVLTFEFLKSLPAEPAVFVVIPHIDKRPACARILEVRIVQIRSIDSSIVIDGGRDVEVPDLFPVLIANNIA